VPALDVERIQRPAAAGREHRPAFILIELAKPPHSAIPLSEDHLTWLSFIEMYELTAPPVNRAWGPRCPPEQKSRKVPLDSFIVEQQNWGQEAHPNPARISPRIFLRSELCDNRHAKQARDY
jgi:hypothetical protein